MIFWIVAHTNYNKDGRVMMKTLTKGAVFGRLEFICLDGKKCLCRCFCGSIKTVRRDHLLKGSTKSCGCLNSELTKERNTKHGMRNSVEYSVWCSMNQRCYDKGHVSYSDYGGRGILVCDEWKTDFACFYKDVGRRPTKDHSIERVDNEKIYSKENCKWATKTEQSRNKRIYKNSKTGVKGVHFEKTLNKYRVTIGVNGEQLRLGSFLNIEDAIDCRKQAELKYWGINNG